MDTRFDIYKIPHKAQRRAIFLTAIAIGRLNAGDETATRAVTARINQLMAHIRDHSNSEGLYIEGLIKKIGPTADSAIQKLDEGHQQTELLMVEVEAQLSLGALAREEHDFYLLFNRLIATYLAHIGDEEDIQKKLLWPNYTDQVIMDAQEAFVVHRNPMSNLNDMAFILPSLNINEIFEFLSSIKKVVPEEPFGLILAIARKTLEPEIWGAVESKLTGWVSE